ncbi:hypothetical protein [Pseudoclavibacter helvolus]|uniref:hypothetical protein n=1 Tax=Pseudoclavibacter helvolus TaxID=255205 RepID=UPI003C73461E
MRSRSSVFLTRLANVASLALAVQLAMSTPAMLTQAPLWLNVLLAAVVGGAVASFSMRAPRQAPWLRDALLVSLCLLQQGLWLVFAPSELASTLPWSWAVWLSASIVVTFRHGRWAGVLCAALGILSYPLSLLAAGGLADTSTVALLVPLFLAPIPPVFDQLRSELDALRAATISGATATASASNASERMRSRLQSRQDFAAFVHDDVLGTLAAAANSGGRVSDDLRGLAGRALAGLRADPEGDARPPVALRELGEQLEAVARRSGASWQLSVPRSAMQTLPAHIAKDLTSAFEQAAQNSAVYAGSAAARGVTRSASLTAWGDTVELRYRDTGPGFVLADVPEDRLGLRGSILNRVEQHPGATATVDTTPGVGTTVTLRWVSGRAVSASTPRQPASPVTRDRGGASALLAFWAIGVVISLTTLEVQAHPLWTVTANILVGAAAASLALGMRLTMPLTWCVASLPLVTSFLLLPQATPDMPKWQFTLDVASLLCAYLIVRGRVLPGLIGFASMGAVGLGWAWHHGGFHTLQGPRWLPTIMIGVALIWWWRLRQESDAVAALRRDEARALQQIQAASVALETVEQEREWVAGAARSVLQQIVTATALSPAQLDAASQAEARIRDRMRSPVLATGDLALAVDAARGRGVSVTLLDDASETGALSPATIEQIAAHLAEAEGGDVVTVRRAHAPLQVQINDDTPTRGARVSVFVQRATTRSTLHFVS